MPVKAWLVGHLFDLETLAVLFREGEPMVADGDGTDYYLASAEFDPLFPDGARLLDAASLLLRRVNGVGRALDSDFRPVRLVGRFTEESGGDSVVMAADTAEMREKAYPITVSGGKPVEPPPPPGPDCLAKIRHNPATAEVLDILGKPTAWLDWFDLYKVYEIIRDDTRGEDAIKARGWATDTELNTFTESANRPEISGDEARHARLGGLPSGRSMTLGQGQELIRRLVAEWLDSI